MGTFFIILAIVALVIFLFWIGAFGLVIEIILDILGGGGSGGSGSSGGSDSFGGGDFGGGGSSDNY